MAQQQSFTVNTHPGRRVSVTARALRRYLTERFRELGLGAGQYLYLLYLFDSEGCTQEELARRAFMDCGCTARALHKLEQDGLIRREQLETDRRCNRILLTDKAREARDACWNVLVEAEAQLTCGLTETELDQLESLLARLEKNSRAMAGEE